MQYEIISTVMVTQTSFIDLSRMDGQMKTQLFEKIENTDNEYKKVMELDGDKVSKLLDMCKNN